LNGKSVHRQLVRVHTEPLNISSNAGLAASHSFRSYLRHPVLMLLKARCRCFGFQLPSELLGKHVEIDVKVQHVMILELLTT